MLNSHELAPKARADGLYAEVLAESSRKSYDWAPRRNGDFYTLASLFENERRAQRARTKIAPDVDIGADSIRRRNRATQAFVAAVRARS